MPSCFFLSLWPRHYQNASDGPATGDFCDFCSSFTWVGPDMDRIPRPEPDPENPGHYKNVFQTLGINGEQRQVDDFLPRAKS